MLAQHLQVLKKSGFACLSKICYTYKIVAHVRGNYSYIWGTACRKKEGREGGGGKGNSQQQVVGFKIEAEREVREKEGLSVGVQITILIFRTWMLR